MAGTKMTLKRYGKKETLYWDSLELIVDQAYLDSGKGLFIVLDPYTYIPDIGQIEVHFNGQQLLSGGGYEEVDKRTIRLDLGRYPLDYGDLALAGQPVTLKLGDEIHIRIWKLEYFEKGTTIGWEQDAELLRRLEQEIIKARKYKEQDTPYLDMDARLDSIERRAESKTMVFVLNKVKNGVAKMDIRFPYEGMITEVYASCSTAGSEATLVDIEKCSQEQLDTSPSWTSILGSGLTIAGGVHSSYASTSPYDLQIADVHANDHFRIRIIQAGAGIEGLTVELVIQVV